MSLSNLKSNPAVETESDNLGGGSRNVESGLYDMTVEVAYIGTSAGGATSLNLQLKGDDGSEVSQTLWVASGNAKGNKTTYKDKEGKEHNLPDFNHANALCLLSIGKELGDLDTEEKVIKLFDFDARKELPKAVPMVTELLGARIKAGIIKQIVDKNAKNDAGVYVPTGEVREENVIDKMFREKDGLTVAEIRAKSTEAEFCTKWKEKWTGVTRDRSTPTAGKGAVAGSPAASGGAAAPATSLFK